MRNYVNILKNRPEVAQFIVPPSKRGRGFRGRNYSEVAFWKSLEKAASIKRAKKASLLIQEIAEETFRSFFMGNFERTRWVLKLRPVQVERTTRIIRVKTGVTAVPQWLKVAPEQVKELCSELGANMDDYSSGAFNIKAYKEVRRSWQQKGILLPISSKIVGVLKALNASEDCLKLFIQRTQKGFYESQEEATFEVYSSNEMMPLVNIGTWGQYESCQNWHDSRYEAAGYPASFALIEDPSVRVFWLGTPTKMQSRILVRVFFKTGEKYLVASRFYGLPEHETVLKKAVQIAAKEMAAIPAEIPAGKVYPHYEEVETEKFYSSYQSYLDSAEYTDQDEEGCRAVKAHVYPLIDINFVDKKFCKNCRVYQEAKFMLPLGKTDACGEHRHYVCTVCAENREDYDYCKNCSLLHEREDLYFANYCSTDLCCEVCLPHVSKTSCYVCGQAQKEPSRMTIIGDAQSPIGRACECCVEQHLLACTCCGDVYFRDYFLDETITCQDCEE